MLLHDVVKLRSLGFEWHCSQSVGWLLHGCRSKILRRPLEQKERSKQTWTEDFTQDTRRILNVQFCVILGKVVERGTTIVHIEIDPSLRNGLQEVERRDILSEACLLALRCVSRTSGHCQKVCPQSLRSDGKASKTCKGLP